MSQCWLDPYNSNAEAQYQYPPALLLILHLPLVTKEHFDVMWIVTGFSVYLFKLVAVNADHN
jgi:hypothetical protein